MIEPIAIVGIVRYRLTPKYTLCCWVLEFPGLLKYRTELADA